MLSVQALYWVNRCLETSRGWGLASSCRPLECAIPDAPPRPLGLTDRSGSAAQQQLLNMFGMEVKYCDTGDLVTFTWKFVLLEACPGHSLLSGKN